MATSTSSPFVDSWSVMSTMPNRNYIRKQNLAKMGLRNPARCLLDPYARSPLCNDARHKTDGKRQASSASNACADCADSCNSDAFPPGFGTRASVPLSAASGLTSNSSMPILASEMAQHTSTA